MCGIAGYVGESNVTEKSLEECQASLANRGPDKAKARKIIVQGGKVVNFIFSRLSIIDLSEQAMQPIQFKNFTILLNGEIYNFRALKERLQNDFGPQEWNTSGDVEVALRYIALKGIDSVADFDGMFAIVLLDPSKEKLYLVRDYFGEKPLYFHHSPDGFYFGSEPKAIWALSGINATLNLKKLMKFMTMGYRSTFKDSDEFFLDLSRVDRGQIYEFSLSDMTLIQKKNFRRFPKVQKSKRTRLQIVNDLKKLVIKSVGRRLESDVPIAICLSGGIDSSIIAAIARRDFGISLESYTLESTDERYSEAASARKIANYLDIPHHIVKMTPHNFFERMERLTRYHEAPIATISYYIQSFLTEQIHRDGFKVSLMGSGADEIFTGYYDHHLAYLAGLKKGDAKIYEEAVRNWTEKILPLVRNPIFQNLNYYVDFPDRRDHLYEGSEELSLVCLTPQNLKLIDEDFGLSPLRNRMMNELFYEVIPVILHEDDRNSMMNSIENRSPFLSYEILEFMISVPDVHLINGGLAKSLLREAFIDYLPEEILFSPRKIGFNANFSELCDVNSKEFQELFMNKSDFWKNVDRNAVIQTLAKLGTEDKYNKMSFAIVASKVFFDCFNNTK